MRLFHLRLTVKDVGGV